MRTKFKIPVLIIAVGFTLGLILVCISCLLIAIVFPGENGGVLIGVSLLLILPIIFLLREAKFKWNSIEINNYEILAKQFMALGVHKRYNLNTITGFTMAIEASENADVSTLYIYANDTRVIEISAAYYKNFDDVYYTLKNTVQYLGHEEFNVIKHIKNSFGVPITLQSKQR